MDVDRINQETRERVRSLFTRGVSKGMTMNEIADAIESEEFDSVFTADRLEDAEDDVRKEPHRGDGRLRR